MSGEERDAANDRFCGAVGGGYTIFLDEERIRAFFDGGDFSSSGELDRFNEIGAQIEKRVREGSGVSFLALSLGEKRMSRDFAVLEIAHILAKHGKTVLIVDCDFLQPGLSGIIENIEEHGFLDLLLYGSSLKTVAKPAGIDGVSVAGPGSFPVSRTIPFALKEFTKIKEYLRSKHDVVIYCSTLMTEDAKVNPLAGLVEGIILCCRIEEMAEGELERSFASVKAESISTVELVCFCGEKKSASLPAAPARAEERPRAGTAAAPHRDAASTEKEPLAAPVLEKSEDLEPLEEMRKGRVNIPRMAVIGVGILIAAFVVWWVLISRSVRESPPHLDTGSVAERTAGAGEGERVSGEIPVPAESLGAGSFVASDTAAARPVEPAAPGAAPADTAGAYAATGQGRYTIHISSFKEMTRAETERAYLEKSGFPARIVEVDIKGERWLRIFVGAYATMDEASRARLDLLGLSRVGYARIVTVNAEAR